MQLNEIQVTKHGSIAVNSTKSKTLTSNVWNKYTKIKDVLESKWLTIEERIELSTLKVPK